MTEIKYGGSGGAHEWSSRAFPKPPLNSSSLAATPIEIIDFEGKVFSYGTAFAFRLDGAVFLVTAWHVLSGKNFFSRKLNNHGLIPAKLRIFIPGFQQDGEILTLRSDPFDLRLSEIAIDLMSTPPEPFGFPVDVAVVKLPIEVQKDGTFTSKGMDEFTWGFEPRTAPPIQSMIGSDIFVLGYPLATYEELKTPLWKRGALASEPSFQITPKGSFLIDVNSAGGMSGGPIIRRVTAYTANNRDEGVIQERYDEMLVGIYSGRALSSSDTSFVIGFGWPIDMVYKIIEEGQSLSQLST